MYIELVVIQVIRIILLCILSFLSNGFEDSLDHFSRQGSGSIPQRQRSQKGYEVPPPGPDIIENEIMRQSNRRGSNKQMKCTRNSDCQCPNVLNYLYT